jgi:hypothetical protein
MRTSSSAESTVNLSSSEKLSRNHAARASIGSDSALLASTSAVTLRLWRSAVASKYSCPRCGG